MTTSSAGEVLTHPTPQLRLRRVLTLWDLVFYGIVLIQPIAAVPLFGIADKLSPGACRQHDSDCHDRDDVDGLQLRPYGNYLPSSRVRLHLRRTRTESSSWIPHGMGHGA